MRTSNPKHPAPNVFCRGIRGFIGGSALGVRRWVFSFIFLFACLGGGFAAPSLSAGELSLSNAATNEVTERALAESDVVALLTDKLQGRVNDPGNADSSPINDQWPPGPFDPGKQGLYLFCVVL